MGAAKSGTGPNLGTEITKQLKELIKGLVEDDEEVRGIVKGLVLEQIWDNPGVLRRHVGAAIEEALTHRWSGEKKELADEVKAALGEVQEKVLAATRRSAMAEMNRQIRRLGGENVLDPYELARFVLDHPSAAKGMGERPHAEWTQLQDLAQKVVDSLPAQPAADPA